MRIVLACRALVVPGGTQTYTLTVVERLQRLGHNVVLATRQHGRMAKLARSGGLRVMRHEELPEDCDALLAQEVDLARALLRWARGRSGRSSATPRFRG